MFIQTIYLFLAALGLGTLIFIHELAHYLMARRVGMKVEAFSIGFGKAIVSWKYQGVQWRLGWIPFGGYVKIAGEKGQEGQEAHEIEGGYYSKKPWDRIKVAGIAPLVNLILAFALFTGIWLLGGREKQFHELTNRVGWVDPQSELYQANIRPGDELLCFNNRPFHGFRDILQSTFLSKESVQVKGIHYNYAQDGLQTPFDVEVKPYQHPDFKESDMKTSGLLSPASYLIYNTFPNNTPNPIAQGSPLFGSGIQYGDRIFAVDGELIFSNAQLSALLNSTHTLLTIQRHNERLLARIPRSQINDFKISRDYQAELGDLKYENKLSGSLKSLYFIPHQVSSNLEVEAPLRYLDLNHSTQELTSYTVETHLMPGDRILAVDGKPVHNSIELFKSLQNHSFNVIVQTGNQNLPLISWSDANQSFEENINWADFKTLLQSIDAPTALTTVGKYKMLKPITPMTLEDIAKQSKNNDLLRLMQEHKAKIEEIADSEKRAMAIALYKKNQQRLFLGASFQDRPVIYNPPPAVLFGRVTSDIAHTLGALVSGNLNPKWMSGPIGIVQVMQHGWSLGIKEALYWLAMISLNLGLFNLLPIPVLDGGQICFALWEQITRKPLKTKTMERIVIPFMIIFIGFFIFVTFHDLSRLIKGVF